MASIIWRADSDSSWSGATNWDSTTVPTSADFVYFNTRSTMNCIVDVDATFKSLYITSGYTGNIDASGHTFTCSGDFTDNGTGSRNFGNRISISDNTGYFHLGSGLGDVTANQCDMSFTGTTNMVFDDSRGCVFRSLFLGTNTKLRSTGSALSTFRGPSIVLRISTGAKFTQNSGISYEPTSSGYGYTKSSTLGTWDGTGGSVYWVLQTPGQSLSFSANSEPLIYAGTGKWYFKTSADGVDGSFVQIADYLGLDNVPEFHIYSDKSDADIYYQASGIARNLNLSKGKLILGSAHPDSTVTALFGAVANIKGFDGTTYDSGPSKINIGAGHIFNCDGNWATGVNADLQQGVAYTLNFINNDASVISNGQNFSAVTFYLPGTRRIAFLDNFSCSTLVANGLSLTALGDITANGNITIDSTTINLGTAIYEYNSNRTIHIGSTTSTINASNCSIKVQSTGHTFDIDRAATFKNLIMLPSSGATFSGAATLLTFSDTSTPLIMGASSTLSMNQDASFELNSNSTDLVNVPPTCTFNGSGNLTFFASNITCTIPSFKYTGTASRINLYPKNGDSTINLSGLFSTTSASLYVINNTASKFAFNTMNYDCTAVGFNPGSNNASGTFTANYGNSRMNINTFNGSISNSGLNYENLGTSRWYIAGTSWIHGSTHTINAGTSILNFTGTSAVTPANKQFYDINATTTNTLTLNANISCNNLTSAANVSFAAYSIYSTGNVYFNNTSTLTIGKVYMLGTSPTLSIASNGGVNNSACELHFDCTGDATLTMTSVALNTYGTIGIGPSVHLTHNAANTTDYKPNKTILTLGNDSTYTFNLTPGFYNYYRWTGTGLAYSLGTGHLMNGTGSHNIVSGGGAGDTSVPYVNYQGTGDFGFLSSSGGQPAVFKLLGDLNCPNANIVAINVTNSTPVFSFNTQGHDVTCQNFRFGVWLASGNTFLYANDSVFNIKSFLSYNQTVNHQYYYLGTSKWTLDGSWVTPELAFIDSTSSITFTGDSTLACSRYLGLPANLGDVTYSIPNGNLRVMYDTTYRNFLFEQGTLNSDARIIAKGNIHIDGTGSVKLGTGLATVGVDSTIFLSSTLRDVTGTSCVLGLYGARNCLDIEHDATFKGLLTGPGANALSVSTIPYYTFSSATTPFTLGLDSTLTLNKPATFLLNATGDIVSTAARYLLTGDSTITFDCTTANAIISIPAFTTSGNIFLNIDNNYAVDSTRKLAGDLVCPKTIQIENSNTGKLGFYTANNDMTVGYLNWGSSNASGTCRAFFGDSSIIILNDVNSTQFNSGTNQTSFYRSRWAVEKNWTFPSTHNVVHAWDSVTFTGDGTVTSNGEPFNWVYVNAPGHTRILSDNFVCREFNLIQGNLVKNGAFRKARDNILSSQSSNIS